MGVVDEYIKSGGTYGAAKRDFENEIKKAQKDKKHPLRKAVNAFRSGNQEQIAQLIFDALKEADGNKDSPLSSVSLFLYRIPMINFMKKYAEENFDNKDILSKMPLEIIQWAGIGVGIRESKAVGGRKRSENLNALKQKILTAWEERKNFPNKISYKSFAVKFINDNGGFDKNGNQKSKGMLSIDTIARLLAKYDKQKTVVF